MLNVQARLINEITQEIPLELGGLIPLFSEHTNI
jgi:hypothetical protein